jgi:hypothetical protein
VKWWELVSASAKISDETKLVAASAKIVTRYKTGSFQPELSLRILEKEGR